VTVVESAECILWAVNVSARMIPT